jgi:acetyl-CoA synthetase (ADP-forming)
VSVAAEIVAAALARGETSLSEHEAKRLIAGYGISVTREEVVTSRDEAIRAAADLGYPVVLKGCHSSLLHKTESDMVRLALRDADAVGCAYDELTPRLPHGGGILIQEMVSGKRELILGLVRDAVFGPCVSVGIGGIFAEALKDVVFRLAPLDRIEARAMLNELRNGALLDAYRGMVAVDREVLVECLVGLARIGTDHPAIREIDVNPVIISGDKPIAVDALVILEPQ